MKKLPTVGLISVFDQKILLAYSKNKEAWYLPGGKVDEGEGNVEALIREIKEELSVELDKSHIEYYCHISAVAYGEYPALMMEQECYLYPLTTTFKASHEIGGLRYFSYEEYLLEKEQVSGVIMVFDKLIQDQIIK